MPPIVDLTIIDKLSSMLIDTLLPLKLRFRILVTLNTSNVKGNKQKIVLI
jgi:hypothetical protein